MIYMTPEGKYVPVTHTQQRLTEFLARTEISWETFQLEIQRSGAPGFYKASDKLAVGTTTK